MKKISGLIFIVMITAFLTGCPKKQTIVNEQSTAPAVDKKVSAQAEEKARKEAEEKAKAENEAKAKKDAEERTRRETEEKAIAEAEKRRKEAEAIKTFRVEDLHFEYDRSDIEGGDRETLKSVAEWLLKNKDAKIQIEGHCDERGNDEFNLALGERRAHSAKHYLITLGINESRISTITYGKEKPLCSESNEDCWSKNRRAHFDIQYTRLTNR